MRLTEAPPERMSEDQIAEIVEALGGVPGLLKKADRRDRAEIYSRIGPRTTYLARKRCSRRPYRVISIMYLNGVRGATRTKTEQGPTLSAMIPLI